MSAVIEIRDLRLAYGPTTALSGLSLRLAADRIHGLLGRNGSGKTSLLSVIAGFRRATSGEVRIGDEPVYENEDRMRDVAFIRESGDTVGDDEKVREALLVASLLRPQWDDAYADELIGKFRVPLDTRVGNLSRGQRSSLGIVLGLAARAPVTIFDETYLGLDAPARHAFYDEMLRDYMTHPRTIILSTHLIEEVSRLFEDVIIIDDGRLLLQEDRERLLERGVAVTGPHERVERHVEGLDVIGRRRMGPTSSVMVFGAMPDERRHAARADGLTLEPIGLQELFVRLTKDPGGHA